MKTQKLNLDTHNLIKLAKHLLQGKMHNQPYEIDKEPLYIEDSDGSWQIVEPYFEYVLEELPYIFEEWYEPEDENTVLWILDEDRTIATSLNAFFGISEDIFFHLLFPGRQNIQQFGGKVLHNDSTHMDIAMNILELVYKYDNEEVIAHNTIFLN